MKRYFGLLIILFIILSCNSDIKVEPLTLYNGESKITPYGSNYISFLANLKNYNNIMALCFIDTNGKILKIDPIDRYNNVDVAMDFINLYELNNQINLIYSDRKSSINLVKYNGIKRVGRQTFYINDKSYGTFIEFSENQDLYIKSEKNYNSNDHQGYWYSYIRLNGLDAELKEVNLGNMYPLGLTMLNRKVYYYINNTKLMAKNIDDGFEKSVFNFEEDIIDINKSKNKLLVLLNNYIYIINEDDTIYKSFNLTLDLKDYYAREIIESQANNIVVRLINGVDSIYKVFNINGNQIAEHKVESVIAGDSYYYNKNSLKLFYSNGEELFISDF